MKLTLKSVWLLLTLVVLSYTVEGTKLRGAKSTRGLASKNNKDKSNGGGNNDNRNNGNNGGGQTENNGYTAPSNGKWTVPTCPTGTTLYKYYPNNAYDNTFYCASNEAPLNPNAQPGDGTAANRAPLNVTNLPNTNPQYVPSNTQYTTAKVNIVVNGETQSSGTVSVTRGNGNE